MRESAAIGFWKNFECCRLKLGAKFSNHGSKRGQIDLVEFGSRGAELFEQTKEMIRSAPDRNRSETLGLGKFLIGKQLFRGQRQQEVEVLSRGRHDPGPGGEQGTKIRGRYEFQTERRQTGIEHAAF